MYLPRRTQHRISFEHGHVILKIWPKLYFHKRHCMSLQRNSGAPPKKLGYFQGKTLHIPSFSKTHSPWSLWPFGVIPEQGKCVKIFSLFQCATRNKSSDFWAAQKYFIVCEQHKFLLFVSFISQNWPTLGSKNLITEQHKMLDYLKR